MRKLNLQLFAKPLAQAYLYGDGAYSKEEEKKKTNLRNDTEAEMTYLGSGGATEKQEVTKGKQNLPSLPTQEKKVDVVEAQPVATQQQSVSVPNVSQSTIDTIQKPFTVSNAYMEAMNYTNSLLEKLSAGRTSHTDKINDLMSQIQNRQDFSYDMNTDTMFQQYLASMMGTGKQAMQDTMGQASALTGGYGSTYAQSVGNQAYNAYLQEAMGVLPEYYQMALDAYNAEGQEMYNQLSMLNEADATEYGRMQDAWSANYTNAQQMYQNEYSQWQDSVNNAYNSASLQLQAQNQAFNQENTLHEREYQKMLDDRDYLASLDSGQKTEDVSALTLSEISELQRIFIEAGGGEAGEVAVDGFLTMLGKNNIDGQAIDQILGSAKVPLLSQSWSVAGNANNLNKTTFTNGSMTMTYKELENMVEDMVDSGELSEAEKTTFLKSLESMTK